MVLHKLSASVSGKTFPLISNGWRTRTLGHMLTLALALGLTLPVSMTAQAEMRHERFAVGHILVKPRSRVADAEFTASVARHGGRDHNQDSGRVHIQSLARRPHIVDVTPGQEEVTVQAMALDPTVEYAEVDRVVQPEAINPNDIYYAYAWHLSKIGTPEAWNAANGSGVTVAILDSGVDPAHPDLIGNLVPGWNLVDNNSNTSDVYGHGTMVAGVVGALSNNGIGVTSIAPNTSLMPVRVAMTSGSAYISTIANGIIYAADHGAQIANASFATLTGSPTIQNAANYMRSKGGLVVVAAGNYGVLDSTPNNSSVISVSATNNNDSLTSWSSYGPYVDVSAPGEGIWTTTNGGGYSAVSGTSFSSPATCAVLALMKSANNSLSIAQLESILKSTAVDLGTPGYDQYFGYGRINAEAAVAAAVAAGGTSTIIDSQAPAVSITTPTSGTVSATVTVSVAASDNVGVTRVDLYAGSTLIGSASTAPYTFSWNTKTTANASINLAAYAYDKAGNKGTSSSVAVTANNVVADTTAPSVTILNPVANSKVTGTVAVKLSASDNVGIASLTLYIDGVLRSKTNTGSLSFSWNTNTVSRGTHIIRAVAKDAAGNTTAKHISVSK